MKRNDFANALIVAVCLALTTRLIAIFPGERFAGKPAEAGERWPDRRSRAKQLRLPKSQIESRRPNLSSMPENAAASLSKFELRDLIGQPEMN